MFFYSTRLFFRNLFRFRIESIINILGLSVGFTAIILLSGYILNEYRSGKDFDGFERVYRLELKDGIWVSRNIIDLFRSKIPEVDDFTYIQESWSLMCYLTVNEETYKADRLIYADSAFFEIFSYTAIAGDIKKALEQDNAIVLTRNEAQKLFPDENAIGKRVHYKTTAFGSFDLIVTAVIDDLMPNALLKFDGIISINLLNKVSWYKRSLSHWGQSNYEVYLKIKEQADISVIEKKLENLLAEYAPEWLIKDQLPIKLKRFDKLYFDLSYTDDLLKHNKLQNINILSLISILLFILVCFNYINIYTADFDKKTKSLHVTRFYGELKKGLIIRSFTESFYTIVLSLFLSFVLIDNLLPFYNQIIGESFTFLTILRNNSYLMLILITAFIICGVLPPYILYRFLSALHGRINSTKQTDRGYLRNSIFLLQYTIALIFIIATIFIVRQNDFLSSKSPGFNKENILFIPLISEFDEKTKVFENELLKIPQIKDITYASCILGQSDTDWGVNLNNEGEIKKINFSIIQVDTTFFTFFGIGFIEGKNFNNLSLIEMHHIFNETAINYFGINDIGNARISSFDKVRGDIIGIIKDFNFKSLHFPVTPLGFIYRKPENLSYIYIKIPTLSHVQLVLLIQKIEKTWQMLIPDWPFEYSFLDKSFQELYQKDKNFGRITVWATIFSIIIATLGLFGVTVFVAQRRTKEIGIRKANGAKTPEIMLMLSKDFTRWVVVAFVIASPITYFIMNKWLQNFSYRINLSWWVFLLAGLIAYTIALLTVSWQSWRAASRNPVEALRYE
ncbi:MAG: FtsX-like permease family protein [Bacteroidales bacterium]